MGSSYETKWYPKTTYKEMAFVQPRTRCASRHWPRDEASHDKEFPKDLGGNETNFMKILVPATQHSENNSQEHIFDDILQDFKASDQMILPSKDT